MQIAEFQSSIRLEAKNKNEVSFADKDDLTCGSPAQPEACNCICLRCPALRPRRVGFFCVIPRLHKLRHTEESSLISDTFFQFPPENVLNR